LAGRPDSGRNADVSTRTLVLTIIAAAFAAGVIHVLSGPDHLAAVAPLSVQRRGRTWVTGFRWGVGHSAGVLLVGLLSLWLRDLLPLEALSAWAERFVGVMLIGIGLWGLRQALTRHVHVHEHVHDGERHAHIHVHGEDTAHAHSTTAEVPAHAHAHAAFAVGSLHGLAGSSHFIGVLPAMAFPTTSQAVAYLTSYGVGTVLAMAVFSAALGLLSQRVETRRADAYRTVMTACSVVALVVGGYWLAA
jgi:ABC-type nickel/cobalt efflux system permease component RcnA